MFRTCSASIFYMILYICRGSSIDFRLDCADSFVYFSDEHSMCSIMFGYCKRNARDCARAIISKRCFHLPKSFATGKLFFSFDGKKNVNTANSNIFGRVYFRNNLQILNNRRERYIFIKIFFSPRV